MTEIVAISGSLRGASSNTALLRAMAALAPASLVTTLRALSWRVVEEASLQITRVQQKLAGDVVTDEETASALRGALAALVA